MLLSASLLVGFTLACFRQKSTAEVESPVPQSPPPPPRASYRPPPPSMNRRPKSVKPKKNKTKFNPANAFDDLPSGVKTEKYPSADEFTCKSMGGNGEPCSYDIKENGSCHEKQYWSDNGYTEYQVCYLLFNESLIKMERSNAEKSMESCIVSRRSTRARMASVTMGVARAE